MRRFRDQPNGGSVDLIAGGHSAHTFARRSDGAYVGWGFDLLGGTPLPALPPGESYAKVMLGGDRTIAFVVSDPAVPGDLDGDGLVNATDLSILLGAWGSSGLGDLDRGGAVNASGLALLLGAWTP